MRSYCDKPLLGFGPSGWIASVILLVLLVTVASGHDLLWTYISVIDKIFGTEFLFFYLLHFHTWHGLSLSGAEFNLISLLYCLVAFAIVPIHIPRWKYGMVIVWALVHPPFDNCVYVFLYRTGLMSPADLDIYMMHLTGGIHELTTCLVLFVVTRSWSVLKVSAIATVAIYCIEYFILINLGSSFGILEPLVYMFSSSSTPIWHIAIGGSLLGWAIHHRVSFRGMRCVRCGYDLRANPARACPECGYHSIGKDIREETP